ncbi:MAG TPA: type 4a pilus biogenesis protein PilO [Acidimicrobiia bacterium]|jgi:type IV pilus assembly protein PilO|nr:type 4a pilus biogenesis protein PilO [Acidimicrobiia bacterium]
MRRSGLILGVLGMLLVTALWWFFVISPTNAKISDVRDELQSAEDNEVLLRTQLSRLKKIQENELTYRSAIGALEAAIPPTPQMPALIDTLAELAEASGVQWDSGTYGNPGEVEGEDYFEIPLSLTVQGQFFEVLGYLYGIADLERIVRIDAVSLSPTQDDNGFTIETVSISAVTFTTGDVVLPAPEETTETTTTTTSGGGE